MSAEQQAIMRGAVPARLAVETAEFDLSALPALAADATSSDKDRRAQYIMTKTHENALKVAYREARVREIGNEMASDLEAAFEARAGQSWKKLKSDHQVPGHAGMLDGKAIFDAIEAVESTTFNSLSTDAAAAAFAELQQMRLADGCSADDVSARFNRFTRDINPYLLEPKGDKGIVRWMLDEMPASCFNAVDAVERLAEERGKLDDPVWVQDELMKAAQKVLRHVQKLGGAPGLLCQPAFGASVPGAGWAMSPPSGMQPAMMINGGVGGGGGGGGGGAPRAGLVQLPTGQKCAEGTCTFKHKGACWSSANFNGNISFALWNEKPLLARLEVGATSHRTTNLAWRRV